MSLIFKRTKEDFVCAHCGARVKGTGYTNHCPKCLWSRHVDNHPGDRASECGGMMEPVRVAPRGREYVITHRCIKCGVERNNIAGPDDILESFLDTKKNMV